MWAVIFCVLGTVSLCLAACSPSITTASGTHAPVTTICSGDLIFADDFEEFDLEKWQHENTLAGGGNYEFQWYNNNRTNSYARDSKLYIRPSLTSDQFSEEFLYSGVLNAGGGAPADVCTNAINDGCEKIGTKSNIINPIKSARIRTVNSFNFRYGKVEISAKMPAGDWLWPAVWMMPTFNAYGTWPASGEIDILESRGNRDMYHRGEHFGTQQITSSLQFGPFPNWNAYQKARFVRRIEPGYDEDFHQYQLEWTPDYLKFSIDDIELGTITPDEDGFWDLGGFNKSNHENPWRFGTKMAPFDQKYYLIINLAVGGATEFFPDDVKNPTPKPWSNGSPTAVTDFWSKRDEWLPTWKLDENEGSDASLQVDYVRVWAL